jgi:hypothetical protein
MRMNDQEVQPSDTVRMVTERQDDCVIYEVIVGGRVRWRRVVDFGKGKAGRAASADRVLCAREQEKIADEYVDRVLRAMRETGYGAMPGKT